MLLSVKEQLKLFLANPIFLACICSWFCSQFLKTIIALLSHKIRSLSVLFEMMVWRTGSLPSSHSAIVSALTTSIGFHSGIHSDIFILSLCFLLVTVRDALGVRRASGIQAKRLNEIGKELDRQKIIAYTPIKEVQGHTPLEVIVGLLIGFSIGFAFALLQ
ncbi:divergent PAP2 family protein [Treponema socranskii]|uniref:divergent PAP2 family protein n=1 Tax=Treponema socranskii TaxID=53419 RepID=UPI003D904E2E